MSPAPDRPSVLLVTVDSLRVDYVVSDQADTPTYEALSSNGVVYERAFAQGPFTTFSMPSLFTSRYPSGLQYVEFSGQTIGVNIDDEPTIPEILQDAGYHTAGFHSNPLLSNLFGFDRGFDAFDARLPLSNTDFLPGRAKILVDKFLRLVRKHPYLPAEGVNERALDWLDDHDDDRPFFLWLHYMDVHGPYIAKEGNHYLNKYRGERLWRKAVKRPEEIMDAEHERLVDLYRAEVEYTDDCLGVLLDGLRDRGLFDETVTVVTADHGEQFREHGSYSHPHQLYDELTHVPLIVHDPAETPTQIKEPVELLDVAPTLVSRVGADVPQSFAGCDLRDGSTDADPVAISEADLVPAYNASIRTATHRYIRNDISSTEELYDLRTDPEEQDDVAKEQVEICRTLADRLDTHIESTKRAAGPDRDVTHHDIDDESVEDRLSDLGYLQ